MTRESAVNSIAYQQEGASIEYWNKHKDNVQADNGQLCDAFDAGAKWMKDEMIKRTCDWLRNEFHDSKEYDIPYQGHDSLIDSLSYWKVEELVEGFKKDMENMI